MYSVCIRLYRLGCRFPQVFVLRLYSFVFSPRLANIILLGDGRSTKVQNVRNCDPSIVLGARWPNGITTARAAAAAPVRPTDKGKGARLRACVRVCVCVCLLKRSAIYFPALPGCRSPQVFVLRLYSSVLVCTPLVLVCTAWDVVFPRFLYLVCTGLYSVCIRLYCLGCRFP